MRNKNVIRMVQNALRKDAALCHWINNICITENDGVVTIAGSVPHDRLRTLARKLASEVEGVNLVIEDIKVEPLLQRRVHVHIDWAKGHIGVA